MTGNTKRGVGPEDVALAMVVALFKPGTVKTKFWNLQAPDLRIFTADYRCNIDTMMTETSCLSLHMGDRRDNPSLLQEPWKARGLQEVEGQESSLL